MSFATFGFAPDWPAPRQVRAWVTERGGAGRYGTCNLGAHVGDDAGAVAANRARLCAELALPAAPTWLTQVHGARVLDLDREAVAPADGAVTSRAGLVCAVLTADCLPVLLCDRLGRRVGVAHAGWRGLLAGVLPSAVQAMKVPAHEIVAWLGPAIGPAHYEVGADVRDPFVAQNAAAERRFERNARDRWQADLFGLARDSLVATGVRAIHGGGVCTFAAADRFFSHRREGQCGRFATLVWLGVQAPSRRRSRLPAVAVEIP